MVRASRFLARARVHPLRRILALTPSAQARLVALLTAAELRRCHLSPQLAAPVDQIHCCSLRSQGSVYAGQGEGREHGSWSRCSFCKTSYAASSSGALAQVSVSSRTGFCCRDVVRSPVRFCVGLRILWRGARSVQGVVAPADSELATWTSDTDIADLREFMCSAEPPRGGGGDDEHVDLPEPLLDWRTAALFAKRIDLTLFESAQESDAFRHAHAVAHLLQLACRWRCKRRDRSAPAPSVPEHTLAADVIGRRSWTSSLSQLRVDEKQLNGAAPSATHLSRPRLSPHAVPACFRHAGTAGAMHPVRSDQDAATAVVILRTHGTLHSHPLFGCPPTAAVGGVVLTAAARMLEQRPCTSTLHQRLRRATSTSARCSEKTGLFAINSCT